MQEFLVHLSVGFFSASFILYVYHVCFSFCRYTMCVSHSVSIHVCFSFCRYTMCFSFCRYTCVFLIM